MTPRTLTSLMVVVLAVTVCGCKDLKIQTKDDAKKFRFGSPVHMWLTYKDAAIPAEAEVSWTSDKDGPIGNGSELTIDSLSAGKHKITITGKYSDKKLKKTRKIEIQNDRPEAVVSEPGRSSSFGVTFPIRFVGAASDREDGTVPADTLVWTSSRDGELGRGGVLVHSTLTPGKHTITLSAVDRAGATGKTKIEIEILNKDPVVTIAQPSSSVEIGVGRPVSFEGSAIDPDPMHGTVAIPADSLEWWSDRDGKLGVGPALTTDRLSPARHRIELRAKDEFGAVGKVAVKVEVVNHPPRVEIKSPDSGRFFHVGERVEFKAKVEDPDGFPIDDSSIVWRSNRDSRIGSGERLRTRDLTPGTHKITCEVTDRHGASRKDTVEVLITNDPPTARITAPNNGETFFFDQKITLEGRAQDPEDGGLSGPRLAWSAINEDTGSRRDLGEGKTRRIKAEDLGFGNHRINLIATDEHGAESQVVSIRVTVPNREPRVTISSPAPNAVLVSSQEIVFSGSALDPDRDRWAKDGELTWTAQTRDGATFALGRGRERKVSNLAPGRYRIVLTAVDPDDAGLSARAHVFVTVGSPVDAATGTSAPADATGGATGALDSIGQ